MKILRYLSLCIFITGISLAADPLYPRLSQPKVCNLEDITELTNVVRSGSLFPNTQKLSPIGILRILQCAGIVKPDTPNNKVPVGLVVAEGLPLGSNSGQIWQISFREMHQGYLIPGSAQSYILKEPSDDEGGKARKEIEDLNKINKSIVRRLVANNITDVKIAQAIAAQWYKDRKGQMRYVVILEAASGKEMYDWTDQLVQHKLNLSEWMAIMKTVGRALGQIHYTFMSNEMQKQLRAGDVPNDLNKLMSTAHRDFHMGNIFYDDALGTVTLIDTAEMIQGEKTILADLHQFYLNTKYQVYLNKVRSMDEMNQGMLAFLRGYASAFPGNSQEKIGNECLAKFQTWTKVIQENLKKLEAVKESQLTDTVISENNLLAGTGSVGDAYNYFVKNGLKRGNLKFSDVEQIVKTDNIGALKF